MKSKQDLKRAFKERPAQAGIFQIRNLDNDKVFLVSSSNLEGHLNGHRFMLRTGGHRNVLLQEDWNSAGEARFVFEVLDRVEVKPDPSFDLEAELQLLELVWLDKLQPFGERGYNRDRFIRHA